MSQQSEISSSESFDATQDVTRCSSSETIADNRESIASSSLANSIRNLKTKLKYSQALESYNEVVLFNINYANTVFEKGLLAARKKKFKQAIDYIDMAIAIVPESDYYLTSKGVSLHNMNKFQEAIECYDQALLINPNSAVAFNFKGIVSEIKLKKNILNII